MRHRNIDRTSFVPTTVYTDYRVNPGAWNEQQVFIGHGEVPCVEKVEISEMDDMVGGFKDRDGIPVPKVVSHSSTNADLRGGSNSLTFRASVFGDNYVRTTSGSAGAIVQLVGGLPTSITPSFGSPSSPAPIDWVALRAAFYEQCDQYIPTKFLIGEDIAESSIYKEAVLIALNPSRAVKTFVKKVGPLLKGLLRPTMRQAHDVAKAAGNSYLSYNFGIKPAVEDLKLCLGAHRKVSSRLQFLRQNRGSFVPIRVRAVKSGSGADTTDHPPTWCECYSKWNGKSTRIGTISAYGRVRDDINNKGSFAAYAQYFGVNNIVGLAWELIPFSFMVDWVTNAQERLRNLTRLQLGGPFSELRSICCSEKLEQNFDLMICPGAWHSSPVFQADISNPINVGSGVVSTFSRSLVIPDESVPLDFDGIGIFHILATGAIIMQRT